MNEKLDLEREFPGEPRLGIDFDQLTKAGGRQVRRRRNLAVFGTASVAVVIIVGASLLVPRLRDSSASGGIPGCATVLGPTSSAGKQTSQSASSIGPANASSTSIVTSSPSPASPTVAKTTAVPPSDAAPSPSAVLGDGADIGSKALTESDVAPAAVPVAQSATTLALDPAMAQDGMTAIVWEQLNAQGATARTNTQLGLPSFYRGEVSDPNTPGWQLRFDTVLDTSRGSGDFGVYISYDQQPVPACHEGELDRRVTYPDGTVVDLTSGSFRSDTVDASGATTSAIRNTVHAVGFHPDGTTVIAMSSDSLNFAGSIGESSGSTPVSLELVASQAANPDLTRSSKLATDVTETSSKAAVPDVLGLTQDEATVALQDAFFEMDTEVVTEPVADPAAVGKVLAQSPTAGEIADQFGKVQVTIGGEVVSEPSKTSG